MSDIRAAEPKDVPGLVASSTGLFAEDAGTRDPGVNVDWPREHGPRSFADGIEDPARLVLVADAGGAVVGHLTGTLTDASAIKPVKVATLVSMYVQPAHRRGQIGARLVEAFLAWAREQGAGLAEVTAYASNTEAIRFYERNGFAPQALTLELTL